MYAIKRSEKEIDDILNKAQGWEDSGSTGLSGMTYEQGVTAGIRWACGDIDEIPIETEAPEDDPDDE